VNLFRTILLFTFSAFSTISLVAQKQFIKGIILSQSDSSIISHAHIINTTSKIGVTSNQTGDFFIKAKSEDTLLISFIGFESQKIQASKVGNEIYLKRAIHTLESHTVLPYKDFKEFREAFINLELKDTIKDIVSPSIMLSVAELKSYIPRGMRKSGAYGNPGREVYLEMLRKDKIRASRFNPLVINSITQIKNENQIKSFIEYCDFTDHFIDNSSEYRLVDQIIYCFEEYSNLSMASN
jgi:hypothetical protein